MPERVLITGGAGFIGSHLAASHSESGDEVHLLVRPGGASRPERIGAAAVVHPVDLGSRREVTECLLHVDPTVIYHMASGTGRDPAIPDPDDWPATTRDLDYLVVLLAAAAQCPALRVLVRAGSLAEYATRDQPSPESEREQPRTVYTAAMTAGAHYAAMLQPALPFAVLTARFALTYGPGQSEDFLLPSLLRRCLAGETCTLRRPGNRRDMVYVDDIVEGLRAMATSDLPGGTILNLSSGQAPTVREIVALALRTIGASPELVQITPASEPNFRVDTLCGAPGRAADLLGWRARISLEEGIARTARAIALVAA